MQTIQMLRLLLSLLNLSAPVVDQLDAQENVATLTCDLGEYTIAASDLPAGAVEGSTL